MPPTFWNIRRDAGRWYGQGKAVETRDDVSPEADGALRHQQDDVEIVFEPASLPERLSSLPEVTLGDLRWDPPLRWTVRVNGEDVGELGHEPGSGSGWLRLSAPVDPSLHQRLLELAVTRLAD